MEGFGLVDQSSLKHDSKQSRCIGLETLNQIPNDQCISSIPVISSDCSINAINEPDQTSIKSNQTISEVNHSLVNEMMGPTGVMISNGNTPYQARSKNQKIE
jgi:hypothetical protein